MSLQCGQLHYTAHRTLIERAFGFQIFFLLFFAPLENLERVPCQSACQGSENQNATLKLLKRGIIINVKFGLKITFVITVVLGKGAINQKQ